jgi:hypothetical protein
MAEVICLTEKRRSTKESLATEAREAALRRLAHAILTHLVIRFYDKGIYDIPVQSSVRVMIKRLAADGDLYDAAFIDSMCDDPIVLGRVERTLIMTLIERGVLPQDFA